MLDETEFFSDCQDPGSFRPGFDADCFGVCPHTECSHNSEHGTWLEEHGFGADGQPIMPTDEYEWMEHEHPDEFSWGDDP
jgi:hypothetical protein